MPHNESEIADRLQAEMAAENVQDVAASTAQQVGLALWETASRVQRVNSLLPLAKKMPNKNQTFDGWHTLLALSEIKPDITPLELMGLCRATGVVANKKHNGEPILDGAQVLKLILALVESTATHRAN